METTTMHKDSMFLSLTDLSLTFVPSAILKAKHNKLQPWMFQTYLSNSTYSTFKLIKQTIKTYSKLQAKYPYTNTSVLCTAQYQTSYWETRSPILRPVTNRTNKSGNHSNDCFVRRRRAVLVTHTSGVYDDVIDQTILTRRWKQVNNEPCKRNEKYGCQATGATGGLTPDTSTMGSTASGNDKLLIRQQIDHWSI